MTIHRFYLIREIARGRCTITLCNKYKDYTGLFYNNKRVHVKLVSFSGKLRYQQPLLLWAYLYGEKMFLVEGLPTLPCCILQSSLLLKEALLFFFIETPFFDLRHIYRVLTVSHFGFTRYLQDFDSLPILDLLAICRILTVSLFPFTCYVQDLNCVLFF